MKLNKAVEVERARNETNTILTRVRSFHKRGSDNRDMGIIITYIRSICEKIPLISSARFLAVYDYIRVN
jgi:hypothetical protein